MSSLTIRCILSWELDKKTGKYTFELQYTCLLIRKFTEVLNFSCVILLTSDMISNFPLVGALDKMSHDECHHLAALTEHKLGGCLLSTECLPLLFCLLFIIHNYDNIISQVLPELGSIITITRRARVLCWTYLTFANTTPPQHTRTDTTLHCTAPWEFLQLSVLFTISTQKLGFIIYLLK